jgi:hypothetical protein
MQTSLIAKLGIDTGSFETGLNKAKSAVSGMLGTLGVPLAAGGMLAFFKATAAHAHDLENQAERLDMSAEALQRLQFAFGQTGVSGDKFNGIMGKFALTTEKAIEGSSDESKALERIAVSADQLIGLSLDQRLMLIADAAKASGDETKVTATMMDLMGKKGFAMVPAMMKGAEGIRQMGMDAKVLDDQMIQNLATIDKWINSGKGAGMSMFGQALQGLETLKAGVEDFTLTGFFTGAGASSIGQWFSDIIERGGAKMDAEMSGIAQKREAEQKASAANALRDREKKTAEEISKIDEETSKKLDEFNFSRLSDEEKINSLMDDRAGLEERANQQTVDGAKARKDQLDIDIKIADLQDKVAKAKEESDKKEQDRLQKKADEEDRILQNKNKAEEDAHNRAVRMLEELANIEDAQRRDGLRSSQKVAEDAAAIRRNKEKLAGGMLPEEEARIKLENKNLQDRADAEFKRRLKLTPEQKNQETRDRHAEEKAQRRAEAHRKSLDREAERKGPSKELERLREAEAKKQQLEQGKQQQQEAIMKTRENTAETVAKLNQIITDGLIIKGIVNT